LILNLDGSVLAVIRYVVAMADINIDSDIVCCCHGRYRYWQWYSMLLPWQISILTVILFVVSMADIDIDSDIVCCCHGRYRYWQWYCLLLPLQISILTVILFVVAMADIDIDSDIVCCCHGRYRYLQWYCLLLPWQISILTVILFVVAMADIDIDSDIVCCCHGRYQYWQWYCLLLPWQMFHQPTCLRSRCSNWSRWVFTMTRWDTPSRSPTTTLLRQPTSSSRTASYRGSQYCVFMASVYGIKWLLLWQNMLVFMASSDYFCVTIIYFKMLWQGLARRYYLTKLNIAKSVTVVTATHFYRTVHSCQLFKFSIATILHFKQLPLQHERPI